MVNHVKRKSLKTIIGAAAGAAAASHVPMSIAAGAMNAEAAGLSITHVETTFGQTVFIKNLSDETVKLESLTPGRIATATGEFDINSLLSNGGMEIQAATTQAHNISSDGRTHNWAVWDTLESMPAPIVTSGRSRPVNVFVHDHSLASAPIMRVDTGQFS